MKVKIFGGNDAQQLTDEINQWLTDNRDIRVIERQICGAGTGGIYPGDCYIAIWYEEKT